MDLKTTTKFDPARGCQDPSTGVMGGFFILALAICYAFYLQKNPGGGPKIPVINTWLPGDFWFKGLSRTYVDVMFMVILCFGSMVSWEFLKSKFARAWILLIAILGPLFLVWFEARKTVFGGVVAGGIFWTKFDQGLLFLGLALLLPWPVAIFSKQWQWVRSPWIWALKTAFFRWMAGWLLFAVVMLIMFYHTFYKNAYYENWRVSLSHLFWAYTFLGWPYAFVTNWLKGHRAEDRSDPGFVLLLLWRTIMRVCARQQSRAKLIRHLKNRRVGIVLRDLLVKIFWIPLMVSFLFVEASHFFKFVPDFKKSFDLFYVSAYHGIFVMDVTLGLIGYASASRWLGNKSRSVDPSLFGWMVALMCYPPFNGVTEGYLPYHAFFGEPFSFWNAAWMDVALKMLTLFMFSIYVWATMAFGLRFSNVTNRGIITRGPYAWVRHPAYLAKNVAWWTENIRSFVSPWQFVFLAGWNFIYYLRAITEENHLMKDPDYQAYVKRVRSRFIPRNSNH